MTRDYCSVITISILNNRGIHNLVSVIGNFHTKQNT